MISIIQDQQDQLMELLQSVSNERDSFKEEVKELRAQLEVEKQCEDCQTAREKARLHLKVRQLEEEKATTAVEPQDHGRVGRKRSRSKDIPPDLSRSKLKRIQQ
ncbi:unnamed protein product [Boreogadus saida]